MSRSKWKHILTINENIEYAIGQEKNIIVNRNNLIIPKDINKNLLIFNGFKFSKPIKIQVNHINKKCGELWETKKRAIYKRLKKK